MAASLAVLLGALLAIAEGFDKLACAGRSDLLATIAGSFGAGASLAVLLLGQVRAREEREGR